MVGRVVGGLGLLALFAALTSSAHADAGVATPPSVAEAPPSPVDASGTNAEVRFELVVGEDGSVVEVRRLSIEPDVSADERDRLFTAAEAYVRSIRFRPAELDGQAVSAVIEYLVRFEPPPPPEDDAVGPATEGAAAEVAAPSDAPPVSNDVPVFRGTGEAESQLRESPRAAVSDLRIEVGQLRRVPRRDAQQMLTLAPGILLQNHSGEGHASAMFLRGFNAAEGAALEVTVEGVPLNEISNAHGHGYVDTLFVIPEVVTSLRVVQGPFDPAQGDFAVAGSAEYRLGLLQRGVHAQAMYGTYGEKRASIVWGPGGHEPGTFAAVAFREGDGFGPNRAFANASGLAQYEGRVRGTGLRYRLLGFGATGRWDSPGVIREDDYLFRRLEACAPDERSQFFCYYDPNLGGSTQRVGASGTLDWARRHEAARLQLFATGRSLRVLENFTGYTHDPRTDGGMQRGDRLDLQYGATTVGLRSTYRSQFEWLGRPQRWEVGLFVRHDAADTRGDRRRMEDLRVPYATDFDRDLRVTNVAAHARSDLKLLPRLSVSGGVRADAFGFTVVDHAFPDEDRIGPRLSRDTFDAYGFVLQPRGTLRVELVDGLSWLLSGGVGARSTDAAALSQGEFAPFARATAVETGFAGDSSGYTASRGFRVESAASTFYTRVQRDLVFDPEAGRNTVIGPSHRVGAMGLLRYKLDGWLDAQASATYTRAHLPPSGASFLDVFAGPRLPYVPAWLVRLDAALVREFRLGKRMVEGSVSLGTLYLGRRPLPLGQTAEPWFLVDAAGSLRFGMIEVGVLARNLFDVRYREAEFHYVSNFGDPSLPPSLMPARHFVAGAPLQVLGQVTLHFDAPSLPPPEEPQSP